MKQLGQLPLTITIALACMLTGCASSGGSTENTGNTPVAANDTLLADGVESAPADTVTTAPEDSASTAEDSADAATISGSTQTSRLTSPGVYTIEVNGDASENLANYLRRVVGVNVIGIGGNARVAVRGKAPTTLSAGRAEDMNPLFIIDGMRWGHSWREVYYQINLAEVKNIRVLKGVEAAMYGIDGANGVIEITHFTARDRREPRRQN